MKLASHLLLIAGWGIVLIALIVLPADAVRSGFVLAGTAVEVLGLTLLLRAHKNSAGGRGQRV